MITAPPESFGVQPAFYCWRVILHFMAYQVLTSQAFPEYAHLAHFTHWPPSSQKQHTVGTQLVRKD